MKILFAAPENAWGGIFDKLRHAHPDVEFNASGSYKIDSLKGFDVLIPTMSPVSETLLRSADSLQLIQQIGAGLEGVDIEAATSRGITVANVPTDVSGNADSVAELGIYLMMALARQSREIHTHLQNRQIGAPMGKALQGKTAGLVGLGGIGKALIQRLRAFNMRLIGIKSVASEEFAEQFGLDWVGNLANLPQLLSESDFVVLSLPDSDETHHLLNHNVFQYMRPGTFLVNLGRGGVIERQALLTALEDGTLGGAGLDVFWQEPPDPQDPIFSQNVIATPHIGGVTDVSLEGIYQNVIENIRRLKQGEPLLHCRN
ncbi:Phosphoglycerate dehydrogenase [Desulfuromusa kysingii]|uniref:Phosphoglycerate dehydrogenase n=1 Tax=Desulfuromusa kysingii TaxID=37625 RepID=A0A1H4BDX9_9BACT|nr:2-hydroxyacid dehydrogenase [Desulfuromusa kysingii]SEA46306.1 Phosphoglycerate dehydrogenase [Desulfuromusa kysingii]